MELIFEFIGQIIGEIIVGFIFKIIYLVFKTIYLVFIRPILISFGFVSILAAKCVKRDSKNFDELSYDELEKAGGDLIIGSLVLSLLGLIIGMIVYFGFYIFEK